MTTQADIMTLHHACERTIRQGSKSFAAAARLFDRSTRRSVYLLYAWCRHCDDRIDGQSLGYEPVVMTGSPRARLLQLREETERALCGEPSDEEPFRALAAVFSQHRIPRHHAYELLEGFAMDVEGRPCIVLEDTLRYSYHVAGVVGVMMAWIMGVRDDRTLDRASDLGIAMQLTNIARDVIDDARENRVYLPLEWLDEEDVPSTEIIDPSHRAGVSRVVRRLLKEADRYYDSAAVGIPALRFRSAWAIAAARYVYRDIGRMVRARGERAWDRRVATGRFRKVARLAQAGIAALPALRPGRPEDAPTRRSLWNRPDPRSLA